MSTKSTCLIGRVSSLASSSSSTANPTNSQDDVEAIVSPLGYKSASKVAGALPYHRRRLCFRRDEGNYVQGAITALHIASALDARFKTLPFLSEEEKEASFQSITYGASEQWDQKDDTLTNVEKNIPPPSSADQTDDEPDLEPTPETSQAQEQEYFPAPKKSKAFEDLFGDMFGTADPRQKTSRDLVHAEVAKYKDTDPFPWKVM
ncbi:unnamed protein product [Arctogadus glacialis]